MAAIVEVLLGVIVTLGCTWAGLTLSQVSESIKSLDGRVGNIERALIDKAVSAR